MCTKSDLVAVVLLTLLLAPPSTRGRERQVQLNLNDGSRFSVTIAIETKSTIEFEPGELWNYRRESMVTFTCTVINARQAGNMRIRFEYDRIRDVCYSGGLANLYDSADPNSSNHDFYTRKLEALRGQSFIAEITPHGRVSRIEGFDDLYRVLHDTLVTEWESPNLKISEEMKKWFYEEGEKNFKEFFRDEWPLSEKILTDTVQQCFFIGPEEKLEPNTTWETEESVASVALRRRNVWTVKNLEKDMMVVQVLSRVRTDPNLCDPAVLNEGYATCDPLIMAYYVEDTLSGQRHGQYTIDLNSGLPTSIVWEEELAGDLKLKDASVDKKKVLQRRTQRTERVSIGITGIAD